MTLAATAAVLGGSLLAGRPPGAAAALLTGLVIQIGTEEVLSRRGRSDLRGLTGLCFTLARCAQVAVLWLDGPVGPDAGVLVVATVVWPVNLAVLLTVVTRRRRPSVATWSPR